MAVRRNLTGDAAQDRTGRERSDDLDAALAKRLPEGQAVKDVAMVAGEAKVIRHGLGRTPQGWIVTRRHDGYALPLETGRDARTLTLSSTNDGTIDLWVF